MCKRPREHDTYIYPKKTHTKYKEFTNSPAFYKEKTKKNHSFSKKVLYTSR